MAGFLKRHYSDDTMSVKVSQITSIPTDCLLSRLFRCTSKKTSKLHVTGLCRGNPPVNSHYKVPVTRKIFSFDDVIM